MTEPIRPWTQYASEEWDRMTRADPLTVWSWTCGTCGAEMPRDAIASHDHDAPTGGAIVWLTAVTGVLAGAIAMVIFWAIVTRWPR